MTESYEQGARVESLCEDKLSRLEEVIGALLPKQGAIEVQQDAPHKCHDWHRHDTDETLIILKGSLTFSLPESTHFCERGTVIFLPKFVPHTSLSHEMGAIYLIARNIICLG